jgi:integrase
MHSNIADESKAQIVCSLNEPCNAKPQTQSVSKEDFDGNPIGIVEEPVSEFIADELSGLDDFINDTRNKYKKSDPSGDLTADEQLEFKVRLRAKEALLKKRRRPPRYLSQCFEWHATNRKGNDAKAAVLLTMFQGGMMPTEIKRLAIDLDNSVVLNGPIPYLTLKEETKTGDARRRLVPIVLGLELIQDHLIEGIEWLNSGIDPSTPSNTLSKRIRVDTGNPALSTHCLRHTWELLCNMEDISITHQAYIGGWSSADKRAKFSKQMLRYGAKGLQRSKMILALQNDQKKIFQHLMHLGDATKKNNVVVIRQK